MKDEQLIEGLEDLAKNAAAEWGPLAGVAASRAAKRLRQLLDLKETVEVLTMLMNFASSLDVNKHVKMVCSGIRDDLQKALDKLEVSDEADS